MNRQIREHGVQSDHVMERRSILTCPICGHKATELMPIDACVWNYDCKACGERLKPRTGDCCVYCSYGTIPCPPMQTGMCCGQDPGALDGSDCGSGRSPRP